MCLIRINSSLTYLPHRNFLVAEEVNVNLTRHVRRPLQVNVEVEKVLDCRNLTERLQLIFVALLGLWRCRSLAGRRGLFLTMRRTVVWGLSLVEPELPIWLKRVAFLRQELVFHLHRETSTGLGILPSCTSLCAYCVSRNSLLLF